MPTRPRLTSSSSQCSGKVRSRRCVSTRRRSPERSSSRSRTASPSTAASSSPCSPTGGRSPRSCKTRYPTRESQPRSSTFPPPRSQTSSIPWRATSSCAPTTTAPGMPSSRSSTPFPICAGSMAAHSRTPSVSRRSQRSSSRSTSATAGRPACASSASSRGLGEARDYSLLRHGATGGRALRAGRRNSYLCVRHHAVRLDAPRACRHVHHVRPRRAAARGARARGADGPQRHRRRRLHPPAGPRAGVDYLELADAELARFQADLDALGMRPPAAEPRATEAIPGMIEMVNQLLDTGHAYLTHGTVYFDVSTFPRFGQLSHYPREHMIRLARARGGNPDDPHRRDPLDFILWQPSQPGEPAWRAPFGVGRPGWHLECSVMSMAALGATLDLHGGGTDLIFPHHEAEVAQSESVTGQKFSRHWLHSAM